MTAVFTSDSEKLYAVTSLGYLQLELVKGW